LTLATLIQTRSGRLDALVNDAGVSIVTKFDETPLRDRRCGQRRRSGHHRRAVLLPCCSGRRQGAGWRGLGGQFLQRSSAACAARRSTRPIAPARRQ